jgi:hypothetical protein
VKGLIVQDGPLIIGLLSSLCQVYHDNYGSVFVPYGVHCLLESQFRICMKFRMYASFNIFSP